MKVIDRLKEQAKGKYAQEAKDCMRIYNALLDLYNGHVWEREWQALVDVGCKNRICYYHPTKIGKIFINGLRSVNRMLPPEEEGFDLEHEE